MIIFWTGAPPGKIKSVLGKAIARANQPHKFIDVIYDHNAEAGDIIVAMGEEAVEKLRASGVFGKKRTISPLRNAFVEASGVLYTAMYDPRITEIDAGKQQEMEWDVQLIARVHKNKSAVVPAHEYQWVQDFSALIERVKALYAITNKAVPLAFDTETVGLSPFVANPEIVVVQISDRKGHADCWYVSEASPVQKLVIIEQIRWILTTPMIKQRGANLKFDFVWVKQVWDLDCTNFSMDTTLVGSLLDENRSNSLNMHAKIYAGERLGGYDDCVAVGTRVCTADLRWVPVESVKPGDRLVGFDEDSVGQSQRRRLRTSIAESTKILTKPGVEVQFSNGLRIRCSDDHGFVAYKEVGSNGPFVWVRARSLRTGARVLNVMPVVEENQSREAGWLSGIYDGEGYVSFQGDGLCSGVSQKPGGVWERYVAAMAAFGFEGYCSHQRNGDGVHTSKHSGWATLQLLQALRPGRLIGKEPFEGKCVPSGAPKIEVIRVRDIGPIEVVSLQTSTRTFVAEGIASHNSFNATHDKSRMDLVPKEDMLGYAGGDVDAVLEVSDQMLAELKAWPGLQRFYLNILHPAARTFEKIERTGLLVDRGRYEVLRHDLESEIARLEKAGLDLLPRRLRLKYLDNLSLGRAAILNDYFFTPMGLNLKPLVLTGKTRQPSTAKSHLEMFGNVPESKAFCTILDELGSAKKTLSTYVVGFLSHLRPDNRFHAAYMLHSGQVYEGEDEEGGTVTGRLSARDPAVQTIPKKTKWAKRIRECFVCPEGKTMLSVDFAQGELRLAACAANEENMIAAYRAGIDLHVKTGAGLVNMELGEFQALKSTDPDFFDSVRSRAKPANFGLLYGMGAEGYMNYSWAGYRMRMTLEQAEKDRNAFFATYPGLLDWHKDSKNIARRDGFIVSPLGRVRHLPLIRSPDRQAASKAQRQAVNSPIQSTLSDLMIWSLAEVDRNYPQFEACAMIHDAGIFYVDDDKVDIAAQRITAIMADLPLEETFGWKPQLRFTADAEAGPDMAHLKKVAVH